MGAIEAIRKALADLESDNVLPRPGRPDDPSSTPATSQGSRRGPHFAARLPLVLPLVSGRPGSWLASVRWTRATLYWPPCQLCTSAPPGAMGVAQIPVR
jgi:hypothetical protein